MQLEWVARRSSSSNGYVHAEVASAYSSEPAMALQASEGNKPQQILALVRRQKRNAIAHELELEPERAHAQGSIAVDTASVDLRGSPQATASMILLQHSRADAQVRSSHSTPSVTAQATASRAIVGPGQRQSTRS